jgi:hypothetical protein
LVRTYPNPKKKHNKTREDDVSRGHPNQNELNRLSDNSPELTKKRRQKNMKRGRPTNPNKAKNRRHSLYLNEKAEYIYRRIAEARGSEWLHVYVSEHLVRDFTMFREENLKNDLRNAQERMRQVEMDISKIVDEIKIVRMEKEGKAQIKE